MHNIISQLPDQILHSLEVNAAVTADSQADSLILAGLGGSWQPGELLNLLDLPTVPLYIHRNYGLPHIFSQKPLLIASSYSGNTEETISAYEAAHTAGYPILVNSAGGTLAEWAARDNFPFAKIDYPGMQPRHTTLASFTGLYTALRNAGLVKDITNDLVTAAATLRTVLADIETPAQAVADTLVGKIPLYIASDEMAYAAWNFKIQTNENTKAPAFWNKLPEANHNELVSFSSLKTIFSDPTHAPQFHAVFLHSSLDYPRTQTRLKITRDLYEQWGITTTDLVLAGTSRLDQIFYAIAFGLTTTLALAEKYGIDPIPVAGVEDFKSRLKKAS